MEQTLYEAIGGSEKLEKLVDIFYSHVHKHPSLIPIFPSDLTETARKQKQFLTQFLGGPAYYTEEHGHPMLRARHLPFAITPSRRDAWLECMNKAIIEAKIPDPYNEIIFQRLAHTAQHMINTPEE